MSGRWCKTCAHLRRVETGTAPVFRCGFTAPAPWPVMSFAPNLSVGARHVVPGDHYQEVLGSTSDWTEVMDCPTWEERK